MSLHPNIVAAWRCEDGSGTFLTDLTGRGNNGNLSDTLPSWTTGKIGRGLDFTGTGSGGGNSWVSVPDSSDWNFGTNDFAISMWVKPSNTTGFWSAWDGGFDSMKGVLIEYAIATNTIAAYFNGSVIAGEFVAGIYTFIPGEWYHLVIRRVSGTAFIHINGIQISSTSNTTNIGNSASAIGKYFGGGENFSGVIDEIVIWKGNGLTNTDITQLYNNGNGLAYPFPQIKSNFFMFM